MDLIQITKLERIIKKHNIKREDIPYLNFEEYIKKKDKSNK